MQNDVGKPIPNDDSARKQCTFATPCTLCVPAGALSVPFWIVPPTRERTSCCEARALRRLRSTFGGAHVVVHEGGQCFVAESPTNQGCVHDVRKPLGSTPRLCLRFV